MVTSGVSQDRGNHQQRALPGGGRPTQVRPISVRMCMAVCISISVQAHADFIGIPINVFDSPRRHHSFVDYDNDIPATSVFVSTASPFWHWQVDYLDIVPSHPGPLDDWACFAQHQVPLHDGEFPEGPELYMNIITVPLAGGPPGGPFITGGFHGGHSDVFIIETEPLTDTVSRMHVTLFHTPSPGGVALLALAAGVSVSRRRRMI